MTQTVSESSPTADYGLRLAAVNKIIGSPRRIQMTLRVDF